jgi:adhesin HecA-like repeat protein
MIASYTRPQLLIREVLQKLPNVDSLSLHASVFGPQFDLFRYYNATERAAMLGVAFVRNTSAADSARQNTPFEGLKANHIVDTAFVRLFAENLEGQVWAASSPTSDTPTAPYTFRMPSLTNSHQVLVTLRGAQIKVSPTTALDVNDAAQMAASNATAYSGTAVTILYGGSGYTPSSTIIVPVVDASGSNPGQGAMVQLTVNASGVVASGTVIASGSGYTKHVSIIVDAPGALGSGNVGVADTTLIPDLQGRPVQPGDVAYVTCNGQAYRRVIQAVVQQLQPSSIGTNGNGAFVAAPTNPVEQDNFSFQNAASPFGWSVGLSKVCILGATVTNAGSGYVSSDGLTVSAPQIVNPGGDYAWTTTQAAASIVLSGSTVGSVEITEPGFGYFDYGIISIPVTGGGSGYTTVPVVSISTPTDAVNGVQATAIAHIAAGAVTAIEITNPGSGYTSAPTVQWVGANTTSTIGTVVVSTPATITSSGGNVGVSAAATPTVQSLATDWNGLVQGSIYQGKYGERYTITCTTPGTTGALVRIRSSSGGFSADNVSPIHRGNYFIVQDPALGGLVIQFQATQGQSLELGNQFSFVILGKYVPLNMLPSGQVIAVNVLNSGTGYTTNSVVTFADPPAGGRIATGHVTAGNLTDTDKLTGITITDPGQGYLYPPAATVSVGTGALVQALITSSSNSCDIAVVPGCVYNGTISNRYILEVVEGNVLVGQNSFTGATVKVSDVVGIDATTEIIVQHGVNYNLGTRGLQFTFPSGLVNPSGLVGTTATATITAVDGVTGAITAVTVGTAGTGYVVPPAVAIHLHSEGTGDGGALQAILNNGVIEDVIVISGGTHYTTGDTLTIAAPSVYQTGLRTGDIYYLDVTAPAAGGAYNTLVLAGQAADVTGWAPTDVLVNTFDIDLRVPYTGEIAAQGDPADAPNLQWTIGPSGILLKNNLKINVASRNTGYQWVPVFASPRGRLFSSWRGLVPATGINAVRAAQNRFYSLAAIQATFGANDQDNPICYGACIAFNGAQGKSVFAASVPTNNLAGYNAVLQQAARAQGPYALCPMTQDPDVIAAVKTHVGSCSLFNVRLWRRAYVSTTSPGDYAVYAQNADGSSLQGSILSNGTGNVRVYAPAALFIDEAVRPGDVYRTAFTPDAWGNLSYQEYVINEVLEQNELILVAGPNAPINPAVRFEIWRPITSASQVNYVGNISEELNDRRMVNVWCDSPMLLNSLGQYVVTPTYYIAAEIAGLRSALLPQQGLTTTQLQYSLNACPTMYTTFSDEDLATAASHGVMIVTQDAAGTSPYIYHQLTTDSVDGSLYYEDSVGVSFDMIAYTMKQELSPYIGKRNATPQVVEELDVRMRHILDRFKKAPPAVVSNIGPALIDYSELFIGIDDTFRDKINIRVTLTFPLPLNTIDLTMTATVIQGEVSTVTLTSTTGVTA